MEVKKQSVNVVQRTYFFRSKRMESMINIWFNPFYKIAICVFYETPSGWLHRRFVMKIKNCWRIVDSACAALRLKYPGLINIARIFTLKSAMLN
jgi:hypothetical protein